MKNYLTEVTLSVSDQKVDEVKIRSYSHLLDKLLRARECESQRDGGGGGGGGGPGVVCTVCKKHPLPEEPMRNEIIHTLSIFSTLSVL